MLTFRLADSSDARNWIQLNREFMSYELTEDAPWGDAAGLSDEEFGKVFEEALTQPERIRLLLMEEDGRPVGFANLLILYSVWAHGKALFMDDLYLKESVRNKGYGRESLKYIERYGKELGCKRLQFYAENSNPGAKAFYEAMGYDTEELNVYIKYFNE